MQRILLVEDDAIIAMAQAALLKRSGYAVALAHSGEAAIRAVETADPPLDLVLMDVDLGPGMDGTEAASKILRTYDTPIVFVSSHTEREMVEKTDRITSYGYVVKHSGETVLLASIKMAFRLFQAYRALTDQGKELRSTNEKYRRSQIRARIGSWEHDFVTDHIWWSEGMYHLLGFAPGTPIALPAVMACFPEDDQVRFGAAVRRGLDGDEAYSMEYTFIRPDGVVLKIRDEGEVIRDAAGTAVHMYGTTQDITEVWEAQKYIRQLSRSVEQSPATVVITDIEGNIEYVNPKFTETTGYAAVEVIGRNPRVLKSGDTSDEEYKLLWETITQGREWRGEFHNRRKDGSLYWESASVSPIVDATGAITHFVAVKEDITERKVSEARLQESESRFRTMADRSPVMIWATDARGRVTMVNRAYREFFGVSEVDLMTPEKWTRFVPFEEEDGFIRAFQTASEGHAPFKARARVRVADGSVRWVDSQGLPQFQADGTFNGFVCSSTDITETKTLEAAVLESEAKYRNLVEMSADGIFINQNMRLVYMNPAAVRMIGAHDEAQLLGRSSLEFFDAHDRSLIEARIQKMNQDGTSAPPMGFTLHRLDGSTLAIEIVASPIIYKGEKGFQVMMRDVSARPGRGY